MSLFALSPIQISVSEKVGFHWGFFPFGNISFQIIIIKSNNDDDRGKSDSSPEWTICADSVITRTISASDEDTDHDHDDEDDHDHDGDDVGDCGDHDDDYDVGGLLG